MVTIICNGKNIRSLDFHDQDFGNIVFLLTSLSGCNLRIDGKDYIVEKMTFDLENSEAWVKVGEE